MFKREQSIKTKLSLSYIIYILLFVLFIALLSNVLIQNQFKKYSIDKQEKQIELFVSQINNTYNEDWNVDRVEMIGNYALNNGYIMNLMDENNDRVWDANMHNGHLCEMVKEDIRLRMYDLNSNWDGKFIKGSYTMMNNGEEVGTLEIEYFNYFYTEDDVSFLSTLNKIYLYSSIMFIAIAILLGTYMSRNISRPLERVVKASGKISRGIYEQIDIEDSNIKEIINLTSSINTLSNHLMNQEQIRKQLTADVTHELRTPLTTLQTHIEAMMDGVIDVTEESLMSLNEEIERLGKIVKDLDNLSRYDNHSMTLEKDDVNISDVIKNVLNIFHIEFEKREIELIYEGKDIEVYIDKDKISQVIINLLSNALKYTPKSGRVEIKVKDINDEIEINVIDNGAGISKEDLPYIFERFYRADKSRNRVTGGAGIGLSIVKSIILAHEGHIEAESEEGLGTLIRILLPKI